MKPDLVAVYARAFLAQYGLDWTGRLEATVRQVGLDIVETMADNFEGALLRIKGARLGTIVINARVREAARRLFTLAHELGHYLLPNQQDIIEPCTGRVIEHWGTGVSDAETDANRFAAEILMPRERLVPILRQPPSFAVLRQIAAMFGTSLSASAYRLCELTSFRAAVVWSSERKARWYKASSEFARYVRLGELDAATLAIDCFDGKTVPDSLEPVPAIAWLYEPGMRPDARVWEHSIFLPSYDAVLTILYLKEPVEVDLEEQGIEDSILDPDEFTIHRKRWPAKR
jgi:Zn-dependent peptidase ImmA (M78 family)